MSTLRTTAVALLSFVLVPHAVGAEPDSALVLMPEASESIQRAFESLRPSLPYESISLDHDHVIARICQSGSKTDCFSVRLGWPEQCRDQLAGPFCVTYPVEPAPAAARAAIEVALRNVSAKVWSKPIRVIPWRTQLHDATERFKDAVWPFLIAALVLLCPFALGGLSGAALRRVRRRRLEGSFSLAVCLIVPTVLSTLVFIRYPLVGLGDGVVEGALFSAGLAWKAHRVFADARSVVLASLSIIIGLLLVEAGTRFLLPPPPRFAGADKIHFWLRNSLLEDPDTHPSDTVAGEISCTIVYGDRFHGAIDLSAVHGIAYPETFQPSAAHQRVLHIGDSMVFGLGVNRDQTFAADLGHMNSDVEQVNAGVPGTSPDDYLAMLRVWIGKHAFNQVVMYLFEANDLWELDGHRPCSNWESLLVYDSSAPKLRFAEPKFDLGLAGWSWLARNSPPPYLVRVLVPHSYAAADLAGAFASLRDAPIAGAHESPDTRWEHLRAILRAARDELQSRGIQFTVVVLPHRPYVEAKLQRGIFSTRIPELEAELGVKMLDATDTLREAIVKGERPFLGDLDVHLNARGHEIMAQWLAKQLPPLLPAQ